MENREEIVREGDKKWSKSLGYSKCPICGSKRIEQLTRSTWWWFYFKCNDCSNTMVYSHGDKMGGQSDGIFKSSQEELDEEKEGKYSREIFGEPTDVKNEFMVQTWGGFYNDNHKKKHGYEPGYKWFDHRWQRDEYIQMLKDTSDRLNAKELAVSTEDGYHTRVETVLHRLCSYNNQIYKSEYSMGYGYPLDSAKYHMEYKWYPGCNDYTCIDDEKDIGEVKTLLEYITYANHQGQPRICVIKGDQEWIIKS